MQNSSAVLRVALTLLQKVQRQPGTSSGGGGHSAEELSGGFDSDFLTALVEAVGGSMANASGGVAAQLTCDGCGKQALGLQRCAKCKQARYCSRVCQVAHWGQHKLECKRGQ